MGAFALLAAAGLAHLLGIYPLPGGVVVRMTFERSFRPYFLLGYDPLIWGLLTSIVSGVTVTLLTEPPDKELVSRMFDVAK